jgi:hypothetical protein
MRRSQAMVGRGSIAGDLLAPDSRLRSYAEIAMGGDKLTQGGLKRQAVFFIGATTQSEQ